jgi:hypothetical protein
VPELKVQGCKKSTALAATHALKAMVSPYLLTEPQECFGPFIFTCNRMDIVICYYIT